ncbi:MAG: helix-turn-helix domain-containing protein [Gemmataceae bacterium]
MLTIRDITERFNVNDATVRMWIRRGELAAINVGRAPGKARARWRITPQALAEFEARRSTGQPQQPQQMTA